jgi:hypothetical protein
MSGSDRPDETMDDGAFADAKPACRALVPQIVTAQWSGIPSQFVSRADPTFVTHLIATAEHVPQTRCLQRATPIDAQTAYVAGRHPMSVTGITTQRTV